MCSQHHCTILRYGVDGGPISPSLGLRCRSTGLGVLGASLRSDCRLFCGALTLLLWAACGRSIEVGEEFLEAGARELTEETSLARDCEWGRRDGVRGEQLSLTS
jgi:hypothetical protein